VAEGVGYSGITLDTTGRLVAIWINLSSKEDDTAFEAAPSAPTPAPLVSKSSTYSESRFFDSET